MSNELSVPFQAPQGMFPTMALSGCTQAPDLLHIQEYPGLLNRTTNFWVNPIICGVSGIYCYVMCIVNGPILMNTIEMN